MKDIIYIIASIILLPISFFLTYSTAIISGVCLAIGSIANYPILYLLGQFRGSEKIRTKIK